jgi:hypothetical protein
MDNSLFDELVPDLARCAFGKVGSYELALPGELYITEAMGEVLEVGEKVIIIPLKEPGG